MNKLFGSILIFILTLNWATPSGAEVIANQQACAGVRQFHLTVPQSGRKPGLFAKIKMIRQLKKMVKAQGKADPDNKALAQATWSLVLPIFGLLLTAIGISLLGIEATFGAVLLAIGAVAALIGLIISIIALGNKPTGAAKSLAIAGLVVSIVYFVFWILLIPLLLLFLLSA
jgi:hypothetical protein